MFDLLFFASRGVTPDLFHLEARLRQSGHWMEERRLEVDDVRRILEARIAELDWKQAADDALPFVRDPRAVELWGAELFREAVRRIEWGRKA